MLGNNSFNILYRNKTPLIILILVMALMSFMVPSVLAPSVKTITYSVPIITAVGGSEADPITFWDLWNASNVNGWNVVHNNRDNDTQYQFDCKIQIGDGLNTTWFIDVNVQVSFIDGISSANGENLIDVYDEANFRLGTLISAIEKTSKDGIAVYSLESTYVPRMFNIRNGGNAWFYSSFFSSPNRRHGNGLPTGSTVTIYNCIFNRVNLDGLGTIDFFDLTLAGDAFIYALQVSGTVDQILIHDYKWAMRLAFAFSQTMTNIYGRDNTYVAFVRAITTDKYLVNPDFDNWAFDYSLTSTANIYRQYEYDLTVTYPNGTAINGTETGARIEIQHYGESATVDYNVTLGALGTISTQVLTMGFYNQTGGDTIYSYNNYNLRIYNVTGYDDYNANFTLNKKEDLTISLTETVEPITPMAPFFFLGAFIFIVIGALIFVKKR